MEAGSVDRLVAYESGSHAYQERQAKENDLLCLIRVLASTWGGGDVEAENGPAKRRGNLSIYCLLYGILLYQNYTSVLSQPPAYLLANIKFSF